MKKFAIQAILLLILIGGVLVFFNPTGGRVDIPFVPQTPTYTNIQIGNTIIKTEVADTPSKRSKGLGDRQSLATDSGMLFIFDKVDRHALWMKGMSFPLDFIWILDDKVVDITSNVPAAEKNTPDSALPVYSSKVDAGKVLEVNAGFSAANNINVGDTVIQK